MSKLGFYFRQTSLSEFFKFCVVVFIARLTDLLPKHFYEIWKVLKFAWDKGYKVTKQGNRSTIDFTIDRKALTLSLRRRSSDFAVFDQIFIAREYNPLLLLADKHTIAVNSIIDLGANVGFVTVFLKSYFESARVICVEPYKPNFQLLQENVAANELKGVTVLNTAVWYRNAQVEVLHDFADKRDWSARVSESTKNPEAIPAITLKTIMDQCKMDDVDIIKIDIEGSEIFLFQNDRDLPSILKKIKLIAIELHGTQSDRMFMMSFLIQNSFDCYFFGETVFGVNQSLHG